MTPRQLLAIAAPCARAEDVGGVPRILVDFKGATWSTLLSVNK